MVIAQQFTAGITHANSLQSVKRTADDSSRWSEFSVVRFTDLDSLFHPNPAINRWAIIIRPLTRTSLKYFLRSYSSACLGTLPLSHFASALRLVYTIRIESPIIMKARPDAIIQREQADYLERITTQSDPLLVEMEAYAAEHRVPIADREVALFLEITARAINARRILEVGMAIGYSVVHLARGMAADGLMVTIEPNDEMIRASEKYLERAGLRDRVRIERGKALDVIPKLNETYDLLFIDAMKDEYVDYLEQALPKLRTGGVVVVDNLLWGGKVANDAEVDKDTAALRKFNDHFMRHPQLRSVVLSVGDGLGYAVKLG
jgi:caffeoyl-CoA O-methyltransferase